MERREVVEAGWAIAPESARPSEDEIAALAYAFWKARGCPEWLWGGMAVRRPLVGAESKKES